MASLRLPISHPEVEVDFLARGRPYRNAHVILPKHFPMRVAGVCLHARKVRIEVAHLEFFRAVRVQFGELNFAAALQLQERADYLMVDLMWPTSPEFDPSQFQEVVIAKCRLGR